MYKKIAVEDIWLLLHFVGDKNASNYDNKLDGNGALFLPHQLKSVIYKDPHTNSKGLFKRIRIPIHKYLYTN